MGRVSSGTNQSCDEMALGRKQSTGELVIGLILMQVGIKSNYIGTT